MTDDRPLVNADFDMGHLEVAPYTKAQARRVTEQIKLDLIGVWRLIADAFKGRIWMPLGYSNWDEYCAAEFGTSRLRLPREERTEVVASLRESGLSIRAIAAATGDHYSTVSRELGRVANATPRPDPVDAEVVDVDEPMPVTGLDGKKYPAKPKPDVPKPKPSNTFNGRFYRALSQLQSDALRLQLLTKEQGFAAHVDELCHNHRDGVVWAQEILAGVLAQMSTHQGALFAETDGAIG